MIKIISDKEMNDMELQSIVSIAAAHGFNIKLERVAGATHRMILVKPNGQYTKNVAVETFAQASDYLDQWIAEYEVMDFPPTVSKKPAMAGKIDATGYTLGKGKMMFGTRYKVGNVTFTFQNPKNLSKKQQQVVYRFMESVDGELAGLGVSFDEYAMWIDLIFQFNRGEITQAQFESITKIKLTISTYDSRSDHNL